MTRFCSYDLEAGCSITRQHEKLQAKVTSCLQALEEDFRQMQSLSTLGQTEQQSRLKFKAKLHELQTEAG